MKKILAFVPLAFLSLLAFTATAFAADAAPDEATLIELAKPVLDAVMSGQGWLAAAGALVLVVALLRRYAPFEFLKGDVGGTLLTFVASVAGACATAFAAGTAPSWALLWTALGVGATAAGGYAGMKRLLAPALAWLQAKSPKWLKPVFSVVLWVFQKRESAADKAKAAGDAAVAAKPSTGLSGVVGEAREIK